MAQVKYKHGTVRNSRHIVRNLNSATIAMLRTINREDLTERGEASYDEAMEALSLAQYALRGEYGLTQEQQVERMGNVRDALSAARKAVVATLQKHKDTTSHQDNMYACILDTIDEAKQHVTAGRQFAKDRRFVPKHGAPVEEEGVADVEVLVEEQEQGLA